MRLCSDPSFKKGYFMSSYELTASAVTRGAFNLDFLQTWLGVFWIRRRDPADSPRITDMVCPYPFQKC